MLRVEGGREIPVHFAAREGHFLVECGEPTAFLQHVTGGRLAPPLPPDAYLRGVVYRNHEAVFQLFDRLGSICPEIQLNEAEARALLRSLC
jgi:hypothetical protein